MVDSEGVIYEGRQEGMNEYKAPFAVRTDLRTLEDAMKGADVFIGLSVRGLVTKEMVASMAKRPIIFALANPDPEVTPEEVAEVRNDAIVATGRSDYPNQVNNVLRVPVPVPWRPGRPGQGHQRGDDAGGHLCLGRAGEGHGGPNT